MPRFLGHVSTLTTVERVQKWARSVNRAVGLIGLFLTKRSLEDDCRSFAGLDRVSAFYGLDIEQDSLLMPWDAGVN